MLDKLAYKRTLRAPIMALSIEVCSAVSTDGIWSPPNCCESVREESVFLSGRIEAKTVVLKSKECS